MFLLYITDHKRSTVPTQNDILVPETLLKKRKSQERAREERALATKEKRGTHGNLLWEARERAVAMMITTNTID